MARYERLDIDPKLIAADLKSRLLPGTCFSIEPGIYLPGDFGIRSELDVYLSTNDAVVFGQPVQTELVAITLPTT